MSIPLKITDVALARLISAKEAEGLNDSFFVRASCVGGGCSGFTNQIAFSDEFDQEEDSMEEFTLENKKIKVVVDTFSQMYMKDVTLDYLISDFQEGFKFNGGSSERKHCACGSSFSE